MSAESWSAIWLTLQLATCTTAILIVIATPLAWWLSQGRSVLRTVIESFVMIPLILPPTVLGFYILILLGPKGLAGEVLSALGLGSLSFTFSGLVIGSIIFSLPFAVKPIQSAFEAVGRRPFEVAATLRAKPLDSFFSIGIPLARPGILMATLLSFAHTVGEFGVVLMIGGNIPGVTRVVSTQIYGHVEALEYQEAHLLSGLMVVFSFFALILMSRLLQKRRSI
jgi:molybdate transport system permease protein